MTPTAAELLHLIRAANEANRAPPPITHDLLPFVVELQGLGLVDSTGRRALPVCESLRSEPVDVRGHVSTPDDVRGAEVLRIRR